MGKESVRQIVKHNPEQVFLAARTESKAESAIAEIKAETPNAPITYLKLDLTSFDSIKAAATEFNSKSQRLDILLNNAGIMATPYSKTHEGYEIQFGTNHMGHFLLTKLLLPTLLRTAEQGGPDADVRIVNLSSDGHRFSRFAPNGLILDQTAAETYGTWTRYGSAKLANILHARALQKRYPQLTCTALHPGVIQTELFTPFKTSLPMLKWTMEKVGGLFMATVEQGTRNQLWCCTGPREAVRKGYYFTPIGKMSQGQAYAQDEKLADKLWEYSEEDVKKYGC